MSSPQKGQQKWGCGVCLSSVPPAYMAQFQVARRMQFGQDPNGLTRESKREMIIGRMRQFVPEGAAAAAALSSPSSSSAAASAAATEPLRVFVEEFRDNNGDGAPMEVPLCRRCFEFSYMIPPTTFDDCMHTIQKERAARSPAAAAAARESTPLLASLRPLGSHAGSSNSFKTSPAPSAASAASIPGSSAAGPKFRYDSYNEDRGPMSQG